MSSSERRGVAWAWTGVALLAALAAACQGGPTGGSGSRTGGSDRTVSTDPGPTDPASTDPASTDQPGDRRDRQRDRDRDRQRDPAERERRMAREGDEAGAVRVPAGVKAITGVQYAEVDGQKLLLDLYVPEKATAGEQRPLIVWIHGGGWRAGRRTTGPAAELVPHGYVVAKIDYRLTGVAQFPAQIHDCKGAIRWLRAHAAEYGIDPTRVGVWGVSAGGHLSALLGTSGDVAELEGTVGGNTGQSSRVQAVCDCFGPSDIARLRADASEGAAEAIDGLFGGTPSPSDPRPRQASPITHVTPDDPPFFIIHGTADHVVPFEQSEIFKSALQSSQVTVTLKTMQGLGHDLMHGNDLTPEVRAFFDQHLMKK